MEIRNAKQINESDIISFKGVTKKMIIGPSINSNEIVLRIMILEPKSSNIYHSHPFPHIWKIEKGQGIYIDKDKNEIEVRPGDFIFINSDEPHCFKNVIDEPLEWLCFGTIESENIKPSSFKLHD
jgi:quercetin dioxygenase-like cupin family protein